ncbi:MAG: LptF/LptG family permease [Candidatus Stahlbacteria bacterium]|nr:LptF/LptG family permease [Candidatus Stahlbacteria bacterium]
MFLHRYIVREHIGPFILGLFTFTFILLMNQIFLLVWDIIGKGISPGIVFFLLLLYLPSIIALTIPMAVMVSSCMAFGRLAQDMEITAIRAAGINPLLLNIMPIVLVGLLTYGMVLFNNHLLPEANHKLKNIMLDIAQKKPCLRIRPLVTMEDMQGYDLQVGAVDYKKAEIYKVKLFDKMTGREIFARSGLFYSDSTKITLLLKDGELHEPLTDGRYRKMGFDEQYIYIPIDAQTIQRDREYRGDRELSAQGLKQKIQSVIKENGDNRYKKRKINSLLVEYHKKYSIPFACLVFVILGCPLAIRVKRGGIGAGFGLTLLFFIFYYVCLIGGNR